jgi:hypothetical protein
MPRRSCGKRTDGAGNGAGTLAVILLSTVRACRAADRRGWRDRNRRSAGLRARRCAVLGALPRAPASRSRGSPPPTSFRC